MRILLCVLWVSVVLATGQTEECAHTVDEDSMIVEDTKSCTVEFQLQNKGYSIEVEIKDLQLDSKDGSYLTLKPEHDEKEYKIVYNLKEPKIFIVSQSKVTLEFLSNSNNNRFSVNFKRHGVITTTEEPTTIITWPTPVGNDSIYYTVNLAITSQHYTKYETTFQLMLVNMSTIYCEEENITLKEEITIANIHLSPTPCPVEWPRPPACLQVTVTIPVFVDEKTARYELRSEHLDRMWKRHAKSYLSQLDWEEYLPPCPTKTLGIWLVASLVGLAVVLVTAIVWAFGARWWARCCGSYSKGDFGDTEKIIATPQRVSDASLWPPSRQEIPPLFGGEQAYAYFEPDGSIRGPHVHQGTTHQHQQHQAPSHMVNVDDSSDEEILTVNSNSGRTSYNQNVLHLDNDVYNRESAL